MKGKDILGSLSPLYGMATGHGLFGELRGGALAPLFNDSKKKKKPVSEEVASDVANAGVQKFKHGGRVDGCAIKGRTKGRNI